MDHQRVAVARDAGGIVVPTTIVVLTVTCVAALYMAATAGDVGSVAFVVVSYGALLLLLRSLRSYELAPPEAAAQLEGAPQAEPLRVWALCTLLTGLFAWKVGSVVPFLVAVGVWAVAAATSAGGFVLLFNRQQRRL
ncbi:unnamed protein product [Urochloa decumbens]|uniref:Uncharacterized protein n=1 Tax=Urochloa decumbens TaxID=240449 RepID=A0ABC9E3J2_9POAL